jgi:capsular exopolysaccharide synthesis family protein
MAYENPAREPEPDAPAIGVVHLREYWNIAVERRRLIGGVVLGCLLATAVFSVTRTPTYRASAVIQVSSGGKINLLDDGTIEEARARSDDFFATQLALLRSHNLALRVVEQLELWKLPFFQGEDVEADLQAQRVKQVERLSSMLNISPVGETQLIRISFVTPEPELSAQLANALAKQYVSYSAESLSGVARVTSDFIQDQIRKLQSEIEENERLLREYSREGNLDLLDQRESVVTRQLQALSTELSEVQAERASVAAYYQSVREAELDSFPEVLNSRTIQDLKREHAELQQRHSELSSKFKPNYPEVRRLRSALDDIEQRIEKETTEVVNNVIAAAEVNLRTVARREANLKAALERQRQDSRDVNAVASDYRRVQAELDNQKRILEQLLRRASATGLSAELGQAQPQIAVRLVDEAVVPTTRFRPSYTVNLIIGTFLGSLLGLGLALYRSWADRILRTPGDIRRHSGLRYLGSVPHHPSGPPTLQEPGRSAAPGQPKFLTLFLFGRRRPPKHILVTSSTDGEGKSFVAFYLARCLTELGRKVLLVDANLRSPKLHEYLGIEKGTGLSDALAAGSLVSKKHIRDTVNKNLRVMTAGTAGSSSSPAELFGSQRLETLLHDCGKDVEHVILDSRSLLPAIDSHVLIPHCEAVVMVARSGITDSRWVQETKELVSRENGTITGIVLNDVVGETPSSMSQVEGEGGDALDQPLAPESVVVRARRKYSPSPVVTRATR